MPSTKSSVVKRDKDELVFFSQSAKLFKILGMWRDNKKLDTTKRTSIGPLVIFLSGIVLNIVLISGYIELKSKGNNTKATFAMNCIIGVLVCCFKMFAIWNSVHEMKHCFKALQDIAWTFENQEYIQKAIKIYRVFFTIGLACLSLSALLFFNIPAFESTRTLPHEVRNPIEIIDLMQSPFYEMMYAYEVSATSIIGYMMMSCDTLFCGVLAMVSGILESISDVFDQAFIKPNVSSRNEEEKLKIFNTVIEDFMEICRIIEFIKDIFSMVSLTHFIFTVALMASSLYVICVIKMINVLTVTMAIIVLVQIFQLGIYCYFGEEVIQQVRELRHKIYECDWYNESKSFKIMILLTLQRLENEPFIAAGKIVPLTLATFTQVMKTAATFSAFLYNTQTVKI